MKKLFYLTTFCLLLTAYPVLAQWSSNPAINTAICTATGDQNTPQLISDGAGGAIITWTDNRSGNWDIYAQRIDANGIVQWTANGVAVCTALGDQNGGLMVSDGSGGAIITWIYTGSSYDIYAQRINASGIVQWTANGVAICTASGNQGPNSIVSDDMGGAIITWTDNPSGNSDIYAQRINASGTVQWTTDGVAVCAAAGVQNQPTSINDGSGGAVITWVDFRSGPYTNIYSQRINANGVVQWTANGVAICTENFDQTTPHLISNGSGGAIITWMDFRSGATTIYAQHIMASGSLNWATNGVAICTVTGGSFSPSIVSDGYGGAIIIWNDLRNGSNHDIYSQRINTSGAMQWTDNGIAICTATGNQTGPLLISDVSGGAITTWRDARSGTNNCYSQRINASGAVQWTANGVATNISSNAIAIVSDGSSGAILTWSDLRSDDLNVYAQNVCAPGTLGPCLVTSIPENPFSGMHSWIEMGQLNVSLNGETPGIAEGQKLTLNLFDISGRLLQTNTDVIKQSSTYKMDISGLAQGMYVVSLQTENTIYSNKIVVSR